MISHLVLCAKSPWQPTIRREHHMAKAAAASGLDVTFVEVPMDLRAVRTVGAARYAAALIGGGRERSARGADGVALVQAAVLAPGHRGGVATSTAARLTARHLSRFDRPDTVVVATTPWSWRPVSTLRHARRAVDLADDWSALIPARRRLIADMHRSIAQEAQSVVIASVALSGTFPSASVVSNATDEAVLTPAWSAAPASSRMAYLGTLSERFDLHLMRDVLRLLPEWSLDLYGQAAFAGSVAAASPELTHFVEEFAPRVMWHGPIARTAVAAALDSGDVLVIPNRPDQSLGQDSMKLYDYLARGRPVVATPAAADGSLPGVTIAGDARSFADAVLASARRGGCDAPAQRDWAARNTYTSRWPSWWSAISLDGGTQ